jgi:uncharacterized protein with HEPN domain
MKDDYGRLVKIRECLQWIEQYTAQGKDWFMDNHMCQDAVLRNFQVIGDAVKELSAECIKGNADIDWSRWARFRDKLTHDYFGVNFDLVWEAIEDRVPEFKNKLDKIIEKQAESQ